MTKALTDVCEHPRSDISIFRGMELIKIATIKLFTPQSYYPARIVRESKDVLDGCRNRVSVGDTVPDHIVNRI